MKHCVVFNMTCNFKLLFFQIRTSKSRHVCSISKKVEVLNIRFSSEGFISCLNCNAELHRDEILSSCDSKEPICICDECGFKDKVDMFISKEDLSSGCPKCAYMKEKKLTPEKLDGTIKTYDCEVCRKSFRSKGHLNRHRLTHYGSKPYSCEECGSRFNQKSSLKTHMLIHDRTNPFSCTWCGQQFRHKQTLANHIVSIHGVTSDSNNIYECDKCKKRFVQKEKFKRHYRSHSGEKPYKCDLCYRTFTQKINLKTHYKKHEEQYSNLCPTEMRSESSVDNKLAIQPAEITRLVNGENHFAELTGDVLVGTKRQENNYTNLGSSSSSMKRDEESYTEMPHSVLNEAEKGKLIQELLSFESMSPENDSLQTFSSIVHSDYREDDSTMKVSGDSNAIYFNSSSSNYIMYPSNSSLYDMNNVTQCSALPTFSTLN